MWIGKIRTRQNKVISRKTKEEKRKRKEERKKKRKNEKKNKKLVEGATSHHHHHQLHLHFINLINIFINHEAGSSYNFMMLGIRVVES